MRKALLKQCGVAENGKPVFEGLFRFRETHGLPLEVVIAEVVKSGGVVGWLELHDEMVAAGVRSPFSVIDDALWSDVRSGGSTAHLHGASST